MKSVLKRAFALLVGDDVDIKELLRIPRISSHRPFHELTERELLTLESEIGAQIFGPVPAGTRREFFCLDQHTWIWHEEKLDKKNSESNTIRYEINEHGVLKVQEGARYTYLEGDELKNFSVAVRMYYEQVARRVYQRDPATGAALA
jgi:hypothetical protein